MSKKRKTRKEKIRYQQRLEAYKKQMIQLKELKSRLELDIKKENKKKKELSFKKNLLDLKPIAPYIISASFIAAVIKCLGGGYPYVIDQTKQFCKYELEYDTKGEKKLETRYVSSKDLNLKRNFLVEETTVNPYTTEVRNYIIDSIESPELLYAILDENMDYIHENLRYFNGEIFHDDIQGEENINTTRIRASLHMIDKNDSLTITEEEEKNAYITMFELLVTLILGTGYTTARRLDYIQEKKTNKRLYFDSIWNKESIQIKLDETKHQIRKLSQITDGIVKY